MSAGRSEVAASYGRGAALLSALIGVTGLFTYAFHSLAAHALGRDGYGLIAVLWAAVFLVASVIYRPVEQLLSRTLAERRAQGRPVGSALRVAARHRPIARLEVPHLADLGAVLEQHF